MAPDKLWLRNNKQVRPAVPAFTGVTHLCGIFSPLAMTGIVNLASTLQAKGSLRCP